jgi:lantibiotic modifying enzyme
VSRLLEAALSIGHRVTGQAFWHEGRCSWVGALPAPAPPGRIPPATFAALGVDVYGGTSGVALFLAHLYEHTADETARDTATGAILHALSRVEEIPPEHALALYTGRLGVALVAARCGRLLEAPAIRDTGASLGSHLLDRADAPEADDLVSGVSGAVVGMLALADELDEPRYVDRASELGSRLVTAAESLNLTGMAHGAAGIVHALHSLFLFIGDERFRVAAERAVAYERGLFDVQAGNWPDLRPGDVREAGDVGAVSGMAWCHGAPGIALSRRTSAGLLGRADREQMQSAVRTTERWVRAAVATRPGNYSLCHGLAGNAEALWEAAGGLGGTEAYRLALDVAERGIEDHVRAGMPWPCGTPAGQTPALMLGLAGIGLFYLRLHDPAIPSVLAPGPKEAALRTAGATGLP